jgi:hypothetical protein
VEGHASDFAEATKHRARGLAGAAAPIRRTYDRYPEARISIPQFERSHKTKNAVADDYQIE